MSINAVVDLSHELRRLALAGSDLAIGDARLSAIVPALQCSGKQVPVFAKIADKTSALLESDRDSAPSHFLHLNVLVVAVLKTQGRTGVEGDIAMLQPATMICRNLSLRVFDKLNRAVDTEDLLTIEYSLKDGLFGDVRLLSIAIKALGSSYNELSRFAAEKLLPTFGKSAVPLLISELDPVQKKLACRLIRSVAAADAEAGAVLARQILDPEADSVYHLAPHSAPISDDIRIAAQHSLSASESDLALLTVALTANKKPIRVAAFKQLLAHGRETDRCLNMLGGSTKQVREALESLETLSTTAMIDAVRGLVTARLESVFRGQIKLADKAVLTSSLYLLFDENREHDAGDLNLALRALQACHSARKFADRSTKTGMFSTEVQAWENGKTGALGRIIRYLFVHTPESNQQDLAPLVFSLAPRFSVIAAIEILGPKPTWALLEHLPKIGFWNTLSDALTGYRYSRNDGMDTGWPRVNDRLPEAVHWNIEWFSAAIRYRNDVLFDHLYEHFIKCSGDQARELLFEGVDGWDCEWALLVLQSDPSCATRLLKKMESKHAHYVHFESLCSAVTAGDAATAILNLDTFADNGYSLRRVKALRTKLTEYFA